METCNYCKKEIPLRESSDTVLNGFYDADIKVNCCFNERCIGIHYLEKSKTKYAGLYSEYPITKVSENIITVPKTAKK
ncbi:hypothetical protein EIB75_10760 [Epilithonimonas vandammei]|uniref:Uncharacterized protein n=1 Tax=Epilithonimonas vandammei TaxID=2487072 RepID=A0A3G8ZES0_9FLAO|nr:hypothetical protein [Epilithonimonas vandammei]AZI53879.1 hypothetical protein EIB75_00795 [Epilithonimonas vandammei]AZI55703.1 hypothetical protein EIB75_10760 [Epilithonimonas vandammei]